MVAAPSPSVTPSPAAVPTSATAPSAQGAAAFVTFYYSELNSAFRSGRAAEIRRLSDPHCGVCNNYANSVEHDKSRIIGTTFAHLQVAAAPRQGDIVYVSVFGRIAGRGYLKDGKVQTLPPGGAFKNTVALQRHESYWLVRAIQVDR